MESQSKTFNHYFYDRNVSDDFIVNYINNENPRTASLLKADVIENKPWDMTRKTTLWVLTYPIFDILQFVLPLFIPKNAKGSSSEALNLLFLGLSQAATLVLLFVMIFGFAYLLPGLYNSDSGDLSYLYNPKVVVIDKQMYEVRDGDDKIQIHKTSSPGFGAHAANAIKGLIYQFKKRKSYKRLVERINNDSEFAKEFSQFDISDILKDKRNKKVLKLLRINYRLSIIFCFLEAILLLVYIVALVA